MTESLIQSDALSWVKLQHLLYEVKQLVVVFILRHHVMLRQGSTNRHYYISSVDEILSSSKCNST